MPFNIQKCHQLTVTKKRNRIPTSYTIHNQTLERVTSAKYLGVELTENLHWGKQMQSTAAKANQKGAFAHKNLKGCPSAVLVTLLQRPCASSVKVHNCGVGPQNNSNNSSPHWGWCNDGQLTASCMTSAPP